MNQARVIVCLCLLCLLQACATLNESECQQADWYQIGERDGARGYTVERLSAHQNACQKYGLSSDDRAYYDGHAAGLERFCLPENGYQEASDRREYRYVCPPSMEADFLREYAKGLSDQLRELDYEYDATRRDLDQAQYQARYAETQKQRDRARHRADQYEASLRRINDLRFQLNAWLRNALDRI